MKKSVYDALILHLNLKIKTAESAIEAAIDSRDNETKSSVGDKYETGRAMMQLEQQKNEVQLAKAITLKKTLQQINIELKKEKGELGALVKTSNGLFFLSIGLGKIFAGDQTVFAISLASPVGKLLFSKKAGDIIEFRGKKIEILKIY